MKKKYLQGLPVLRATDRMIETAKADTGKVVTETYYYSGQTRRYKKYKHYVYFRATVEDSGILKVSVFKRTDLVRGMKEPAYVIFLDNKEMDFITLDLCECGWRTAKIDSLHELYREDGYRSGSVPYASATTVKTIQNYTGKKVDVQEALLSWQADVRAGQLSKRHKRETDVIDAEMNLVPDLPKDFQKWCEDEAFINSRYLFYMAGKNPKAGWCVHCGKHVELKERPKMNKRGRCPSCWSIVTYKTYNGQQHIQDERSIAILQKMKDGERFVLREFHAKKTYRKINGYVPELLLWETARDVLHNDLTVQQEYCWDEYKNTHTLRWCYITRHFYYHSTSNFVLYSRNLKILRKDIPRLKYIPIEQVFQKNRGEELPVFGLFNTCVRNPEFEYLIKCGLTRLTIDLSSYSHLTNLLNGRKKPWDMLNISKDNFRIACKNNYGDRMIRIMQKEKALGIRMTEKEREWICDNIGVSMLIDKMVYTTPHRFIRYMDETLDVTHHREIARDYLDYISDCQKLRLNMTEDIMFPVNFQEAHRIRSEERILEEDKRKSMELAEKNKLIENMQDDWEKDYGYEDDTYKVIFPHSYLDLKKEGNNQHHCVGTYFDRVVNETCVIAFIRKKEDLDKSYCTVELRQQKIIQNRMKYNENPPEECMEFISKWHKEVEKRFEKKRKQQRIMVAAG